MAAPRKENIRDIILDTARTLLESRAFSDISLAEISRTAGISKGTLYYHYKTKGEILFDLADLYLQEQWNNFIAWTSNAAKDTSLRRLIKYVVERSTADAGLRMHLYYEAQMGDEGVRKKLVDRYAQFYSLIRAKIAERTDLPAEFLTWLVFLISDGIIVQKVIRNPDFDAEAFLESGALYLKKLTSSDEYPLPGE